MIEIPGYTISKELGAGGMATVYQATHEFTKREVAIKVMSQKLAADPSFGERFLHEATCANLSHPNIITVYDGGEVDGHYYIAMEYVSGGDLTTKIKHGITIYEAVKVMKQMAAALGYAHERQYVHRDVKPDNILFRSDGSAVLADFGIAKATAVTDNSMTAVGTAIGSPHYMSPEQARGRELDGRSDLYSLGIVFYEMLTGSKPFDAEDTYAIGYMHINDPVPQLPDELAHLQPILDRLLAKNPDERFANADELKAVLDHIKPGPGDRELPKTEVIAAIPSGDKKGGSGKLAVAAILVVALAAGGYFLATGKAGDGQGDTHVIAGSNEKQQQDKQRAAEHKAAADKAAAEKAEAERKRQAELKRAQDELAAQKAKLEAEKKRIEEERRRIAEKSLQEERERLAAERRRLEEERRAAAARAKSERDRLAAEKKRLELARLQEEKRKAEAERKQAEAERLRKQAEASKLKVALTVWGDNQAGQAKPTQLVSSKWKERVLPKLTAYLPKADIQELHHAHARRIKTQGSSAGELKNICTQSKVDLVVSMFFSLEFGEESQRVFFTYYHCSKAEYRNKVIWVSRGPNGLFWSAENLQGEFDGFIRKYVPTTK